MISLTWKNNPQAEIEAIMGSFSVLPRYLAKKHLQAAMKRTIKDGVPVLKKLTPKRKTKVVFGRNVVSGEYTARKVKGGSLRLSVTSKAKYIGRNGDGSVYGVIGYRAGDQSRKAIWLVEGTRTINPRAWMTQFHNQYSGPSLVRLQAEMAAALEKAVKELIAGKNPGSPF